MYTMWERGYRRNDLSTKLYYMPSLKRRTRFLHALIDYKKRKIVKLVEGVLTDRKNDAIL